jgi:hypothetical protein
MWLNQDIGKWLLPSIHIIGGISIMCFIIGDVLGIVCLFSNPTLTKTLLGIVLFFPATVILLVGHFCIAWSAFLFVDSNGREHIVRLAQSLVINGIIASFITGTFILLIDVIFLKVAFGIHLLFSYCLLLLLLFGTQVYRAWSAIPEEDTKARFIAFLENIVPIEFPEEWLGDWREGYYQLIKEGKPPWKVGFITLFTGLGLILSYLWLKADKLVSRWMTRAK